MGKPPELPRLPDRAGHFGAFGGRYVPETLMTPLARAGDGLPRGAARPGLPGASRPALAGVRRPSDAAHVRRAPDRARGAARAST